MFHNNDFFAKKPDDNLQIADCFFLPMMSPFLMNGQLSDTMKPKPY